MSVGGTEPLASGGEGTRTPNGIDRPGGLSHG